MKKKFLPLELDILQVYAQDVLTGSNEGSDEPTYGSDSTDDYGFDFWN